MRVAKSALWAAFLLASCQKAVPDFTLSVPSPDGGRKAVLNGFQPRGTIEGNLVLSFRDEPERTATFRQIENGQIGWVAADTLAIVADRLEFYSLDSEYFSDGTIGSRIRVIVCAKQDMDCSDLAQRLARTPNVKHIGHFPEG
jgi:hypothetical protein